MDSACSDGGDHLAVGVQRCGVDRLGMLMVSLVVTDCLLPPFSPRSSLIHKRNCGDSGGGRDSGSSGGGGDA